MKELVARRSASPAPSRLTGSTPGAQVLKRSYEGLVAKDEASPYVAGRPRSWLKVKLSGWTDVEDRWKRVLVTRVAQQLGHSSVKVTEDDYLHLTAGDRRHKVGAYAAAIAAKRANRSTTGVGPELSRDRSGAPSTTSRS
jgi:ATP-dependent DNA ligase